VEEERELANPCSPVNGRLEMEKKTFLFCHITSVFSENLIQDGGWLQS